MNRSWRNREEGENISSRNRNGMCRDESEACKAVPEGGQGCLSQVGARCYVEGRVLMSQRDVVWT